MIQKVKIDGLKTDYSYQRVLDVTRAKKIAREFSPELMGIVTLSKRDDGNYFIIDGNHRIYAAKMNGENEVLANVFEGLSIQDEVALFNRLNQSQKKTTYNENLKASYIAGNEEARRYIGLLDKLHIPYSFASGGTKALVAHNAAIAIMKTYGGAILGMCLDTINKADAKMDSRLIKGVARFLTYPGVNLVRLEHILRMISFEELVRVMGTYDYGASAGGHTMGRTSNAMAKAIASFYNKNLRLKRVDLSYFDRDWDLGKERDWEMRKSG